MFFMKLMYWVRNGNKHVYYCSDFLLYNLPFQYFMLKHVREITSMCVATMRA